MRESISFMRNKVTPVVIECDMPERYTGPSSHRKLRSLLALLCKLGFVEQARINNRRRKERSVWIVSRYIITRLMDEVRDSI